MLDAAVCSTGTVSLVELAAVVAADWSSKLETVSAEAILAADDSADTISDDAAVDDCSVPLVKSCAEVTAGVAAWLKAAAGSSAWLACDAALLFESVTSEAVDSAETTGAVWTTVWLTEPALAVAGTLTAVFDASAAEVEAGVWLAAAVPLTISCWPIASWSGLLRWFQLTRSASDTCSRSLIWLSVSPLLTV